MKSPPFETWYSILRWQVLIPWFFSEINRQLQQWNLKEYLPDYHIKLFQTQTLAAME